MNDTKNTPKEFVADTAQQAMADAAGFFGCGEPELKAKEYGVIEVSGLGSQVMIVAVPKNAVPPKPSSRPEPRESRGGRDSRGDGEGRPERRPRRDREDRSGRRPRRDREDRPERVPSSDREENRDRKPQEAAEGDSKPAERAPRQDSGTRSVSSDLGQFVEGLVDRMGIGQFSIEEGDDGDLNVVSIRGEAADVLTSGDGRVVDAIQFLVNQASLRGGDEARKIVLEVEGDPDRREAYLTKLADRAARRAEDAARAMALDPMNPKDRRIIHVALREIEGIATMSVGSGRYRRVVVVPEGAPEYEEAMKSNRNSPGNS